MLLRFQVPPSAADAVIADMRRAGYDITLLGEDRAATSREVLVRIFAGQSHVQAELLMKRLVPEASLVSAR
jgi:hypothetical protein